jgi:hypothetical protein
MSDNHEATREIPLSGGLVTFVVRVGETVRRATGPWSPAVHALLRHLDDNGFDGASRFVGTDHRGREILTFNNGTVPSRADPRICTESALADVGRRGPAAPIQDVVHAA